MVSKIIKTIYILMVLMILGSFAFADLKETTITWVVPTSVTHLVGYPGSCDAASFFFVEDDGTIDGTLLKILPTTSAAGDTNCQGSSAGEEAMSITNGGSVILDINMIITDSIKSGVTLKAWHATTSAGSGTGCGTIGLGGWEASCSQAGGLDSEVPTTTACANVGDSNVQLLADLGIGDVNYLCFAADFAGVTAGSSTNKMQSNAWSSGG